MSRFALICASLIVLTGCSLRLAATQPSVSALTTAAIQVGSTPLTVEVAATPAAQQQGLSGRTGLVEGQGMLFTFASPSRYEFWMYDMRFGLDFLWLAGGHVAEVTPNVPPPTPQQPNPVRLRPNEPADAVIEVPAGWAQAHGVVAGVQITGLPK